MPCNAWTPFVKLLVWLFNGTRCSIIGNPSFCLHLGLLNLSGNGSLRGRYSTFWASPLPFRLLRWIFGMLCSLKLRKILTSRLPNPSFVGKFHILFKVLFATHAYYSSCWAPSKASTLKLECLFHDFLWVFRSDHHGFHRVAWDFYYLPKESRGLGLLSTYKQGLSLCAKWIIHAH